MGSTPQRGSVTALCKGVEGVGALEKGSGEDLEAPYGGSQMSGQGKGGWAVAWAWGVGAFGPPSHPRILPTPTRLLSFLLVHLLLSTLTVIPSISLLSVKPSPEPPPPGRPPGQC